MDAVIWDVTVFTKNRERLLEGEIAAKFFNAVMNQAEVKKFLSDDHFSVDGTLIESLGLDEELPAQGWQGRAAGSRRNGRAQLPQGEALQ